MGPPHVTAEDMETLKRAHGSPANAQFGGSRRKTKVSAFTTSNEGIKRFGLETR